MEEKALLDVVIAGGGPAGLSALQWCAELGLKAILIEKEPELGGQLLYTYNPITNYLGWQCANGRELRGAFLKSLHDTSGRRVCDANIVDADLPKRTFVLADGAIHSGGSIIIATGVRRRKLGIPGEREFRGRGILDSGAKQRNEIADKQVVIVGGGDAALENAIILAKRAERVMVVHRRAMFTARSEFLEPASSHPKIEFVTDARMTSINGDEKVKNVGLVRLRTGEQLTLKADAVLIRIGVEPNSDLFRDQIDLDPEGYVVIDRNCATSLPNVFAVGDVANPTTPTIAAAVGQACIAVKTIAGQLNSRLQRQ